MGCDALFCGAEEIMFGRRMAKEAASASELMASIDGLGLAMDASFCVRGILDCLLALFSLSVALEAGSAILSTAMRGGGVCAVDLTVSSCLRSIEDAGEAVTSRFRTELAGDAGSPIIALLGAPLIGTGLCVRERILKEGCTLGASSREVEITALEGADDFLVVVLFRAELDGCLVGNRLGERAREDTAGLRPDAGPAGRPLESLGGGGRPADDVALALRV